ncbi:hypothetical protein F511_40552 [Dorcoceras hygrometricum]|uniref:Uncharacterized protein n=1 Tax=Dorcoceras hygrometricum TaxID=472368 RepID=A0A2Z7CT16_9LAMI|nr:hypothetical protein F511_40552 [Dorcoceras hygrometricum]
MESAAGLAMETSKVKSAVHARRSDVVEELSSRKLLFISRCYLEIAIAKRCRLHKLIRQRFALALKDSAGRLCVDNQSQDPVASYSGSRRKQQQHPVESLYEPAAAMNTVASFAYPVASFGIQTQDIQSKNGSAAKQLTTYEELSKLDVNC